MASRTVKKHVLFDLDGVLIDALDLHKRAFIEAVKHHVPDDVVLTEAYHDEHLASLNTRQKLFKLMQAKVINDVSKLNDIHSLKQRLTAERFDVDTRLTVPWLPDLIVALKTQNRMIGLVSNSVRVTCERALNRFELSHLFDVVVSSDDVLAGKPSPDPYQATMNKLWLHGRDVVAVEDSVAGVTSARDAGCWPYVVLDPAEDLRIERFMSWLKIVDAS